MLVAASVPLLVTVMVCAALVWPICTLPKDRALAEALTFEVAVADPVPERLTETLVPPLPVIAMLPA